MASMIGLNNNSDDSDSENVVTQDEEVTITKKKRGEGKTFFFRDICISWVGKKSSWRGRNMVVEG